MEVSTAQPKWRSSALHRIASLAPFGLAVALALMARTYLSQPMGTPPDILGIPVSAVFGGIALAWAALGALIVWTTSSRVAAALAVVFMTFPSMLALLLGPAAILILQNLP